MNYYPFHLGDYSAHTAHLTPIEDIAYRRLLDLYYLREAPLPMSDDLPRLIRMRDHADVVAAILGEFFQVDDQCWRHPRCDEEIVRYRAMVDGGRNGAAKRWAKPGDAPPIAKAKGGDKGGHAPPNANQNQNQEPKKTPLPPASGGADGGRFEEFWTAWPKNERKQDKAKCLDHWRRNQLDAAADAILGDVRVKRGTQKWAEGFIEAPLVYLRGRRWQDGVTPATDQDVAGLGDWRATRTGIEAKGAELGLGRWDEDAFQHGRGEHFQIYRARVEAAVSKQEQQAA